MADASPASKEAAIKARIIGHMNKDHSSELEHYLQAFNGIPASAARGAQIADMDLDSMTITAASSGKTHRVALDPPLENWGASRVRLVAMAHEALARLGLSDVKVERYAPPVGFHWVILFGVVLYFVCAATLGFVRPGTAVWGALDRSFPYGAAGYRWLVKAIFVPVVAIHVVECWWMATTRLEKYRIETGSGLWWAWIVSTFLEGGMAFVRIDGLVEEGRRKKEAEKH